MFKNKMVYLYNNHNKIIAYVDIKQYNNDHIHISSYIETCVYASIVLSMSPINRDKLIYKFTDIQHISKWMKMTSDKRDKDYTFSETVDIIKQKLIYISELGSNDIFVKVTDKCQHIYDIVFKSYVEQKYLSQYLSVPKAIWGNKIESLYMDDICV